MASSISKRNSKNQYTIFETAPKATLLMLLTGLFILFAGAFFIQKLNSPIALSTPFAIFALYSGAISGGVFCSHRLHGRLALACAVISSAVICVMIIIAKAFIEAPQYLNGFVTSLITHLSIPVLAIVGALIGGRIKTNKEIKKRKNHYRSKK